MRAGQPIFVAFITAGIIGAVLLALDVRANIVGTICVLTFAAVSGLVRGWREG